jgi:CRP/FNR family transcriptional regulator
MKEYEFYKSLDDEQKTFLLDNSKKISLQKDTILFYQGDVCNDILLLESGKVRLFIYGELDEQLPLYEIGASEQCIVNTASTLSNTKAIATAICVSDISGWLIPGKIVQQLILKSSSYQEFIFSLFAIKFSALTTIIEDIKFKKLDLRILEYLKKHQIDDEVIITHEALASEIGTSRVVVSRVLKDLQNKGYIELHHKKISLLNHL